MTYSRFSRQFLRFGTSLGLVLFVAGCATSPSSSSNSSSDAALAAEGDQAQRMLRYCRELHQQGDHYVATGVCKKAFELDQTNPEALHILGQIMMKAGSPDKAAEAYFMALHLDSEDVEARYGLSKAYMMVDRHDLAIPHLTAALEKEDEDYRLYNAMGIALDQQGRHAEAQAQYHQGLALKPTNPALNNNLNISQALAAGQNDSAQLSAVPTPDPTQEPVPEPTDDPLAAAAVAPNSIITLKTTDPVMAEPVMAEPVVAEPVVTAEPVVEQVAEVREFAPQPEPTFEVMEPGPNEIEAAVIAEPESEPAEVIEPGQSLGQASSSLEPVPDPAQDPALSELDRSAAARISDALPWVGENSQPAETVEVVEPERPQVAMVSPEEVHEEPEPQMMSHVTPTQEAALETPPPVEISSDGPVFMVQVGSYLEQASALDGWQVITEGAADLLTGFEPRVVRADAGEDKGIVYRLRTGPLADYSTGTELCTALSDRGFGCFVVKMTAEEIAESDQPGQPEGLDIRG